MKGSIFNIQKFSVNDGSGIRTIVFFQGCPLRCQWCSNPESQELLPQLLHNADKCIGCGTCAKKCPSGAIGPAGIDRSLCTQCGACERFCPTGAIRLSARMRTVDEVVQEILKDKIFYDNSGGGVTLSGGEPLLQWQFSEALLQQCHTASINTAIETTCCAPQAHLQAVAEHTDTVLCDVKLMNPVEHAAYTGLSNELILKNIAYLSSIGKRFILRIPLIREVNCNRTNLLRTAQFAAAYGAAEVHLLPYHRLGESKYARLGKAYSFVGSRPDEAELNTAREYFTHYGLPVVVGG